MRRSVGKRGYLDILERNEETDSFDIVSYGYYAYHDFPIFAFGISPLLKQLIRFTLLREDKFITLTVLWFFAYYTWERE